MTTAATLTDLSKPGKHAISWCDETWNWLVGCSRISVECDRCYAAEAAKSPRLQQFPQYQGVERWDGTVNFVESQLSKPLGWKKPRRIFTCSMSDVFHPNVPDEWRDKAFAVMAIANQHTYQALTKRTQQMLDYFSRPDLGDRLARAVEKNFLHISPCLGHLIDELEGGHNILRNCWLGTTAGCQSSVDERLPILSKLTEQGWTTFVSAEPLLEPINLHLDQYPVSQIITGAESGRGARPMEENWVRSLRDQCQSHQIPFFYKQNFAKGKKISLPELDGQVWAEFPSPILGGAA